MIKPLCRMDDRPQGKFLLRKKWIDCWFLPFLSEDIKSKIFSFRGEIFHIKDLDTDSNHFMRVKMWHFVGGIVFLIHWYSEFV